MNAVDTTELEGIQALVWDLYKDAYGVRPHHITDAQWKDLEYLKTLFNVCLDAL